MTTDPSTESTRVWFITGASSGFGQALCEVALDRGDAVVATTRSPDNLPSWTSRHPQQSVGLSLDVTDDDQVRKAVSEATERFGRIDVAVNNAGHALVGAIEEASDSQLREQLEVNLHGVINVTRAVLPVMRQQRHGHLVQMSSLNGVQGLAGGGCYAASKFAVEGLSESLAQEVAHLGIRVTIVEPGPHRTRFARPESMRWSEPIDDYGPTVGATRAALKQLDGNQPGDPSRAARAIAEVVDSPDPPLRLALGRMAVDSIEAGLAARQEELNAWRALSLSNDFPA
jgi:NAD(P)-dependent dehydrogenase (short-subunit alcohol dehydrogenase family)